MHQGRQRDAVDCVGLVVLAARDCGLDVPLEAQYGRFQNYQRAASLLREFCHRVSVCVPGDLVLFKNTQNLNLAIVTEISDEYMPTRVIHAQSQVGRVVETGLSFPVHMIWRISWR